MKNFLEERVLILAAGSCTRWIESKPKDCDLPDTKHFLPLGTTTIIGRTVKLCKELDRIPTIAAPAQLAIEFSKLVNVPIFLVTKTSCTLDTFLKTSNMWAKRTHVLLGDVVFARNLLKQLFSSGGNIKFFGDLNEIFGFSFNLSQKDKITNASRKAMSNSEGKIRDLRRILRGKFRKPLEWADRIADQNFYITKDFTQDIDRYKNYIEFQKLIVSKGKLEKR